MPLGPRSGQTVHRQRQGAGLGRIGLGYKEMRDRAIEFGAARYPPRAAMKGVSG